MNNKELLIISVTIFLTIIVWIIADIYHITNTEQVENINPRVTKNIDVDIDVAILDILKQKE